MGFAIAFSVAIGLLTIFQIALAAGAPWGRFAWGGQQPGRLPVRQRVGSAVTALVYVAIVLLALDRGGVIDVVPDGVSQVGMWVAFGLLALGILPNAISRSKQERAVMTPVAAVLAVLALLVALLGPGPSA